MKNETDNFRDTYISSNKLWREKVKRLKAHKGNIILESREVKQIQIRYIIINTTHMHTKTKNKE